MKKKKKVSVLKKSEHIEFIEFIYLWNTFLFVTMFRRFDIDLAPFLDEDIYTRTIRIEGRVSREEALKRLSNAGISISDIVGMYREGENSPWSAVLRTKGLAESIHADGIKYLANFIIDIRVHWLPLYVNDDIIKEVLAPFGKVLDITRDKTVLDKDTVTFNGTRLVKFQTTDFDSKHIPHVVSLGSCGMLITMKGRPPICLKCRQLGHLRKDCPEKTATYASVASNRKNPPSQQATPVPQVPVTPVPQEAEVSVVTQAPQTETTILPDSEEIPEVKEETEIPTVSKVESTANSSQELEENRLQLFDVDTLTWQTVRKNKRVKKSSPEEDDNYMES